MAEANRNKETEGVEKINKTIGFVADAGKWGINYRELRNLIVVKTIKYLLYRIPVLGEPHTVHVFAPSQGAKM